MKAEEIKPLIEILLNIERVRVTEIEIDEKKAVIIKVVSTEEGTKCRKCGEEIRQENGEDEAIQLRHIPMLEHKVYIEIKPKRYICNKCKGNPTTTQRLNWYEARRGQTKAYEKYILKQLINSTVADVSIKEDVGYKTIEAIIDRNISREVNWDEFDELNIVGIDEISLKKGHRDFVTIISAKSKDGDVSILAVLEGRKKETIEQFLETIPSHLKKTIRRVCTDLYDGFINAVKKVLPRAKVVADRFHVAKAYRNCVDLLRKREMKRLKKLLPKPAQEELKGAMWALRKNKEALTPEEQDLLQLLFAYSPKLKQAYRYREQLTTIFDQYLSKKKALRKINNWQKRVKKSGLDCFNDFLITLDNWKDEITNFFLERNSSAFVEGFNNKIKVLKRRCFGIFNLSHLFQRIVLDLQGYDLFVFHTRYGGFRAKYQ
jgi:transposase